RVFHRIRSAMLESSRVPRSEIRPDSRFGQLVPRRERPRVCELIGLSCGSAPETLFRGTIREFSAHVLANSPGSLKPPGEPWTRDQIRSVVRAVLTEQN